MYEQAEQKYEQGEQKIKDENHKNSNARNWHILRVENFEPPIGQFFCQGKIARLSVSHSLASPIHHSAKDPHRAASEEHRAASEEHRTASAEK